MVTESFSDGIDGREDAILTDLRKRIEAVDGAFVRLLIERQELVELVAARKTQKKIPLRNFSVEKQVIARFASLCQAHGLRPAWGSDLAQLLVGCSVELQSSLLDRRCPAGRFRVLMVGGLGEMGRWMGDFLINQGHQVSVHDPKPGPSPFPRAESLASGVAQAEVIVLAVPLGKTPTVLAQIIDCEPEGVVVDLCSLKKAILPVMRGAIARGLRMASLHPLFGPDTVTLGGRNVVLCPLGCPEADEIVASLFTETAANLVRMDPEVHDRLMTMSLGISHALNLVFARTLDRLGLDAGEVDDIASSTFSRQFATTQEVMGENMDLYFEIQRQCDSEAIYGALASEVQAVGELVQEDRREEFIDSMHLVSQRYAATVRHEPEKPDHD